MSVCANERKEEEEGILQQGNGGGGKSWTVEKGDSKKLLDEGTVRITRKFLVRQMVTQSHTCEFNAHNSASGSKETLSRRELSRRRREKTFGRARCFQNQIKESPSLGATLRQSDPGV